MGEERIKKIKGGRNARTRSGEQGSPISWRVSNVGQPVGWPHRFPICPLPHLISSKSPPPGPDPSESLLEPQPLVACAMLLLCSLHVRSVFPILRDIGAMGPASPAAQTVRSRWPSMPDRCIVDAVLWFLGVDFVRLLLSCLSAFRCSASFRFTHMHTHCPSCTPCRGNSPIWAFFSTTWIPLWAFALGPGVPTPRPKQPRSPGRFAPTPH